VDVDGGVLFQQDITLVQSVGTTSIKDNATFNPGTRANIGLGYNINDSLAAEFGSGLIYNSMDKGGTVHLDTLNQGLDQYSIPMIASLVYRVHGAGPITPYIGVGAGGLLDIVDIKNGPHSTDTDFTFAWQAQAGIRYAVCEHASVGLGYQFLGSLDQHFYDKYLNEDLTFKGVYTHAILLTFTWQF